MLFENRTETLADVIRGPSIPDSDRDVSGFHGRPVRWTLSGVPFRRLRGLPPTHKPIEFDGVDIYVRRNGCRAAHWNFVGMWAFYRPGDGPIYK